MLKLLESIRESI